MAQVYQRGRGDKDQLEAPEPDVRHGEVVIVAHVLATGLQSITHKVRLLISPHTLCRHHENHDPEDEDDRKPDLPNACGVPVDTSKDKMQLTPIHLLSSVKP
uniref:Uncharacterized protein n=1 Tax=Callorhinchus milii TaxID=7868 RepID=A0A4W3HM11_CALMI